MASSRSRNWAAAVAIETRKLGNREDDWNLASSSCSGSSSDVRSTRFGGTGRPNLNRVHVNEPMTEDSDYETEEESSEEEDALDDFLEALEDEEVEKPPASRVILEVSSITETLTANCHCALCHGPVEVTIKTLCLASRIILSCKNPECSFVYNSPSPATSAVNEDDDARERSSDYAVNISYVLGFVGNGDGGTEAARVLGLLGLPNDTTMETRTFPMMEERINPKLEKLASDIVLENLTEEVRLTMAAAGQDISDFQVWKSALDDPEVELSQSKFAKVDVSFDMGWQQRSSGKKYASHSGHALLVGHHTRKAVAMCLKSKLCCFCRAWPKNPKNGELPIPPHHCRKNHEGSSTSMEPSACLEMVVNLYDKRKVITNMICIDDDASTRSKLRWSNEDYMRINNTTTVPQVPISKGPNKGDPQDRPDNGKLPAYMPEPVFVADPNHRRKVFTGLLLKMVEKNVSERHTLNRNDTLRLEKNFGYMARCLPGRPESEFVDAGKAVIEHHFDNHQYCGQWCPRRLLTPDEMAASRRFYVLSMQD
jgi:hypothetical protein